MNTILHSQQNQSTTDRDPADQIRQFFEGFLETFEEIDQSDAEKNRIVKPYHNEAHKMTKNKGTTMFINFKHLTETGQIEYLEVIYREYFRYEPQIKKAIYNFMYKHFPEYSRHKIFYPSFFNLPEIEDIRQLKTEKLGKLLQIKGTLTKTTEVRPELLMGNFKCRSCKNIVGFKEQQFKYTEPNYCTRKGCTNQTQFELIKETSVYVDWQKIKVQESNGDLPSGTVPRTMDVVLRNEIVEKAQPGDRVLITGTLIVVPDIFSRSKPGEKNELKKIPDSYRVDDLKKQEKSTIKAQGITDLNYKLVFLANNVVVNQMRFQKENNIQNQEANFFDKDDDEHNFINNLTNQEIQEIDEIKNQPDLFNKVARLIAPSVLENMEVKKGIILMLFGGVNKKTRDGMKIRGDINICLVGDPSTAKSQFLKFVNNFIPRTVYTSGRGSSSAGLTASLSKDPDTNDFTLEAGALMLADNGICCIDEFDKIMEKDTVAIHEAMEQQTISITKAGIQATLNARCSILAAMNPICGRYDKTKNLSSNIRLSAPLMSRFDIFFVLTDQCKESVDMAIAKRIVQLHKNEGKKRDFEIENEHEILTHASLLRYMNFARHVKPKITQEAKQMLVKVYQRMRTTEFTHQKNSHKVTVRSLESLIRLSEACARVHCSLEVTQEHVQQAVKLLNTSIIKIDSTDYVMEVVENDQELQETQNKEENKQEQNPDANNFIQNAQQLSKETFQITKENYKAISDKLLRIFKELTESSTQEITPENLALNLIQEQVKEFSSLEQLRKYERMVKGIIKRMVKHEKVFQSYRNVEGEEIIRMHPNANVQIIQFQ